MNPRDLISSLLLFSALGLACGDAAAPEDESPAAVPIDVAHAPWAPGGEAGSELDVGSASARRLSVDQLERSLEVIGGFPEGSVELPPNLAFTLGQPDFQSVTDPARDPSPLFMKFMVDLAGFVCSQILNADRARPQAQRVLSRHEDPDQNLRAIWFRFTGISGSAADEDIERLAKAESQATGATGEPDAGRLAVCIAAATSPEFLLY